LERYVWARSLELAQTFQPARARQPQAKGTNVNLMRAYK
jgi:hypothetical protein